MVFSEPAYENVEPPTNKAIRGFLHVGGWYFEKLGEKETRATLILELNLGGSLGQGILQKTNVMQGK